MSNYFGNYDMKFYWVYVLELEDGKFYVGITKNLQKRYHEHCSGVGADYTCLHKPIQMIYSENTHRINKKQAEHVENITTIQWMIKEGIENVRGGDYCSTSSQKVKDTLGKEAYDKLFFYNVLHRVKGLSSKEQHSVAESIYRENTSQHWLKDIEVHEQIDDRIKRNGNRAFCSVDMCANNHHKQCSFGLSPYDVDLCEQHYCVRV